MTPTGRPGDEPTLLADVGGTGPELEAGMLLGGRFEIVRRLGEGGAGVVFAARDRLLGEPVALKLLHGAAGVLEIAALRDEVRAARRIAHANVCRVHDLCEHRGRVFLVMELLGGETLRQRLRRPMGLAEKLDVARQLGAALAAAHRAGVVHCDVKPENTFLADDRVVLTDFGIARRRGDVAGARRHPGSDEVTGIEGTPAYMAPEQLLSHAVDERTDLYALGAVVFELLAGRPPHGGLGQVPVGVLVQRVLHQKPELPEDALAELPEDARGPTAEALARALAKEPGDRFEGVEAFVAALVAALGAAAAAAGGSEGAPSTALAAATAAPTVDVLPEGQPTVDPAAVQATSPARPSALGPGGPRPTTRPGQRPRGTRRLATALHLVVDAPDDDDDERSAARADALVAAAEATLADAGAIVVGRLPRSIVAVFGATVSRGDEGSRAADAARAVVSAAGAGLGVRVGLEAGRLLVREDGARLLVTGDAIDRAAALVALAAPGQVLAGARAARHVARRHVTTPAPAGGPAAPAVIVGARRPAGELPVQAPLLGRDAELGRLLDEVVRPARTREPGAALVLGPAGAGKTRLLGELLDVLAARGGLQVLAAAAEPAQSLAPFGVTRALLRRAAGVDADEDPAGTLAAERLVPDERSAAAAADTPTGRGTARALRDALVALLGAGTASGARLGPGVLAAARAALAAAAAATPIVVVVDDLQWADDGTLDLVEGLARGEPLAPIAVLALARPELAELRPRLRAAFAQVVELGALPADAATALAARCLDTGAAAPADPAAAGALAAAAEGNPYFIEELAAEWRARGPAAAGAPALPTSVEDAIQARLDRLDARERELVRAASVLGARFHRGDLLALADALELDLQPGELDDLLAALEARHVLAPVPGDDDELASFRHTLFADAAYRELPPATRRLLHGAAATALRRRLADAADRGADVGPLVELARHHEGADQADEAAALLRRAGARATAQRARGEAYGCFARARALLGERADAALLVDLAEAAVEAGHFAEADDALAAVGPAARAAAAPPALAARVHAVTALAAQQRGRWDQAVAAAEAGLAALGPDGELGERALAARLRGQLGWVLGYIQGDNARGLPESLRAVELLESVGSAADRSAALSRLGANYMRAGRWRDQLACNRRALALADEAGALDMVARAHLNLGVNLGALGELDESIASSRRALGLYSRMGATGSVALCHNNLALSLCDAGRDAEAEQALEVALALSARLGGLYFKVEAECTRARLAFRRGDAATAEAAARGAVAHAAGEGARADEAMARRVLGALLSHLGRHDEALAELSAAAALGAGADLGEAARVAGDTARALRRAGRTAEADAARASAARALADLGAALDQAKLDDLSWI